MHVIAGASPALPAMSFGFYFRNRVSDNPLLPLTNTHRHPPSVPLTSTNTPSRAPSSAPSSPSSARVLGNGCILAATMPHLSSKHQDPYLALSREEEHLQKDLQKLIDAQSEGLLAGFAGASDHDERDNLSSTGSRTPTTASISSMATPWGLNQSSSHYASSTPITIPIRQPARRKISLHGARRGITRAISSLAHLKSSQASLLSSELVEKSSDLSTVQSLSAKQSTLEEQIRAIAQAEDASRRTSEMKKEEKVLDEEIRELEDRLWQMKARQKGLLRDIQGLENRVESQLSSYKAALELTKKEAKSLLKRAPRTTATANVAIGGQYGESTGEGIWSLPSDRRTLPMAEEHFLEEQQTLTRLIEAAKFEQKECEEGAQVWEDVIRSVSALETTLRTEMQHMTNPSPPPPRPSLLHHEIQSDTTNDESTELSPEARITKVLMEIRRSILLLESKLSLAHQRGWKLLDVCISAEVEAMREGEQVLSDALNPAPSSPYSSRRADDDLMDADEGEGISPVVDRTQLDDWPKEGTHLDDIDDVWGDSHHQQQQQQQQRLSHVRSAELLVERSEDEYDDEGPGPELLISHF